MPLSDIPPNTAISLVLAALLATAVAVDIRTHRIPNYILLPALFLAMSLNAASGGLSGLLSAGGGFALGTAILLPLYAVGGMGAGDVKLLGVVGSFIGPWGAIVAGMSTMMAGAVYGMGVILWRRLHAQPSVAGQPADGIKPENAIPYAPAIAAGTLIALWYIDFLPESISG